MIGLLLQGALATFVPAFLCPDFALVMVLSIGMRWDGFASGAILAGLLGNKHGREGGHNITFNAIAPGPFPGMLDEYLETEEGRAAVGAVTVSGRVGKPEDVGAACIYFASPAGSYVTGALLPVDGGLLVGKRANS